MSAECLRWIWSDAASRRMRLAVLVAIALAGSRESEAQTVAPEPAIIAEAEMRVPPGIDTPFTIGIANSAALPPRTMMLIRGLPTGFQLNRGRAFGAGVWVVPTSAIGELIARVRPDIRGSSEIMLAITTLDGRTLTEKPLTIVFANPPASAPLRPATAPPPPALSASPLPATAPQADVPPATQAPTATSFTGFKLKSQDRDLAIRLMASGDQAMISGNVLVARQFYQRAAENGLPEGALALAGSYDAALLTRSPHLAGVQPNPELARKWSAIAEELRLQVRRAQNR